MSLCCARVVSLPSPRREHREAPLSRSPRQRRRGGCGSRSLAGNGHTRRRRRDDETTRPSRCVSSHDATRDAVLRSSARPFVDRMDRPLHLLSRRGEPTLGRPREVLTVSGFKRESRLSTNYIQVLSRANCMNCLSFGSSRIKSDKTPSSCLTRILKRTSQKDSPSEKPVLLKCIDLSQNHGKLEAVSCTFG